MLHPAAVRCTQLLAVRCPSTGALPHWRSRAFPGKGSTYVPSEFIVPYAIHNWQQLVFITGGVSAGSCTRHGQAALRTLTVVRKRAIQTVHKNPLVDDIE